MPPAVFLNSSLRTASSSLVSRPLPAFKSLSGTTFLLSGPPGAGVEVAGRLIRPRSYRREISRQTTEQGFYPALSAPMDARSAQRLQAQPNELTRIAKLSSSISGALMQI